MLNESINTNTNLNANISENSNEVIDDQTIVDNEMLHSSNVVDMDNINNINSSGCALTTFDNPYDPFDQFTSWFLFDVEKGYNTCSYLARIAKISDDMSEEEVDAETERAIDEIIEYDFLNIYKKIRKNLKVS